MNMSQCPRCQKYIPDQRRMNGLSVCECGWIGSIRERRADSNPINSATISLLVLGALIVTAFIHIAKWDTEGVNVLKIQVLELAGSARAEDYKEFERICSSRKMLECVESSIERQINLGSKDTELQARLGKMYFQKKEKHKAYRAFTAYFTNRGRDIEAAYLFAVLLSDLTKLDQSLSYLQFVLKYDKEHKYQMQATRSYVMILVAKQNYEEAKNWILKVRSEDQKANLFMEDTLRLILDQTSKKAEKPASIKNKKKS